MQQSLFSYTTIRKVDLISDSPRKAFYRLRLETYMGEYCVRKESGGKGKVLDRRSWCFLSQEEAEKLFDRRLREKTRADRKSPRKYKQINPQ